jgi:hypothetical protein
LGEEILEQPAHFRELRWLNLDLTNEKSKVARQNYVLGNPSPVPTLVMLKLPPVRHHVTPSLAQYSVCMSCVQYQPILSKLKAHSRYAANCCAMTQPSEDFRRTLVNTTHLGNMTVTLGNGTLVETHSVYPKDPRWRCVLGPSNAQEVPQVLPDAVCLPIE